MEILTKYGDAILELVDSKKILTKYGDVFLGLADFFFEDRSFPEIYEYVDKEVTDYDFYLNFGGVTGHNTKILNRLKETGIVYNELNETKEFLLLNINEYDTILKDLKQTLKKWKTDLNGIKERIEVIENRIKFR